MKMLPHNVILYEAVERQYRDRIQKEAKNARILRRLIVRDAQDQERREKKLAIEMERLEEVHA